MDIPPLCYVFRSYTLSWFVYFFFSPLFFFFFLSSLFLSSFSHLFPGTLLKCAGVGVKYNDFVNHRCKASLTAADLLVCLQLEVKRDST